MTLAIRIPQITHEKFWEICQANQGLRLELTAGGEVVAVPLTYPWTGNKTLG